MYRNSLHSIQRFHRRHQINPTKSPKHLNTSNSFANIRRVSRSSDNDLVSILQKMLGDNPRHHQKVKEDNKMGGVYNDPGANSQLCSR